MNRTTTQVPERLAMLCLSHFEKEEAVLQTSKESLLRMQTALMAGRMEPLLQALREQEESGRLATELHETRRLLRERLAQALEIPAEQVTLRVVSDRGPTALRQSLLASRQRLLQIGDDIERIHRGNSTLLRQSIGLLQRLLGCLLGKADDPSRYTAEGLMESVDGSNFLNADC